MSFRQRRKRVIWSHRGRGARRNARCFFLLITPLHLPQAARCSEPVNSRCGSVWQGRRFGSASKVKKSRKTGVFLLCQLNRIHLIQWLFNKWSVCVANIKRQLRCHEVLAMLARSKARFDFHAVWPHFISEATSFFMHRRCIEINDPFIQKHSRLARLERFAMLVVSSCSEHRFICRRQRGAPSQLTAGAAVCGRVTVWVNR